MIAILVMRGSVHFGYYDAWVFFDNQPHALRSSPIEFWDYCFYVGF
jgi:hypothetical protein